MSNDPRIEAVPALDYYNEPRSAPFLGLFRLVLLAGAISALIDVINGVASFIPAWPRTFGPALNPSLWPLQSFYAVAVASQMLLGTSLVVSCVVMVRTGRGRSFTIWGEALLTLLKICVVVPALVSYAAIHTRNLPVIWRATQITQSAATLVAVNLLPIVIIAMLLRKGARGLGTTVLGTS